LEVIGICPHILARMAQFLVVPEITLIPQITC
jgi:hypothetical protein